MATRPVTVRILHQEAGPAAGPIERWVASARAELAERHRRAFGTAGAADVAVVSGPPDDTPFGARLRQLVAEIRPAGLVLLGSGAIPLARPSDYRAFVAAAAGDEPRALANNRYSADIVAVAGAEHLGTVPDLPADNALPRWLGEVAGIPVDDLRRSWRLAIDVDGPLELAMLGWPGAPDALDLRLVRERLGAIRAVAAERRAELVVAGRVPVVSLTWLEVAIPARVRAFVEERGMRASSPLAMGPPDAEQGVVREPSRTPTAGMPRPPASVLGMVLDHDGPGCLGAVLGRLGEAAVVDTRVLLAHRLGTDERRWPVAEDRFASDLLLADRVRDPWLRDLTYAAMAAPIPVLLGGHSLVGPGVRLLFGTGGRRGRAWR